MVLEKYKSLGAKIVNDAGRILGHERF